MIPGRWSFTLRRGSTFRKTLTWKDAIPAAIDLSGCTARMQARDASGVAVLTLTSTDGIALGGAAGTITFTRTAVQTETIATGVYSYDFELTTGAGDTFALFEGTVVVLPEQTQ